ncbi:MAG: Asp-tRNA(Asn)/Glu-tRNA(Gln) amidotransferase subunit GatB [Chlamydiae bacterium]|nr:Asp-tRNA(Asn)/Glu-tRNA(Gln) amidotransferase subunit GatB [Chlamydiota bacterium]
MLSMYSSYETIIGLEIHVELNTASKLFSPAPNHFGDEPNINISEICTGQPGSLPKVNREAFHKALQFGLAIGATIPPVSYFDRKSYFYPDSPRGFQITQFYNPIIVGGNIRALVNGDLLEFSIHHAHLEDDAGTLRHFSQFSGVDYNRAGVPLIEIVSEPCMRTPKEASAYVQALKAVLEYLSISDCNMEEGSLRMDVNISVRKKGESLLRNKIEIKNMNSFAFMEKAIEAETKRQISIYENGHSIQPSTYRWDPEKKETVLMRLKESAEDYRYQREPDLTPLFVSKELLETLRKKQPELPLAKFLRYRNELGLSEDSAAILVSYQPLAQYFDQALLYTSYPKQLSNWITGEFAGRFKEMGSHLLSSKIPPNHIAYLVNLIEEKTITGKMAKLLADLLVLNPEKDPRKIIQESPDFQPLSNEGEIAALIESVIKDNPQSLIDHKAGKDRAFSYLVGQVMKRSGGKASPEIINTLLKKALIYSSNDGE